MAGSPERKTNFLGIEVKPSTLGLGGLVLVMAGVWAGNEPCIALPAIIVGTGLMVHSIRKMERQE